MTAPVQPIASALPAMPSGGQGVPVAAALTAVTRAAAAPALHAASALPPAPVLSAAQWSAQTVQNLKLQAFEHLIAQLALQIQGRSGVPAAPWPAQGLPAATQQLLQSLLSQIQVRVQGQLQPLQLLAAQQGSVPLMQALVHAATDASGTAVPSSALQTAAALSATVAAALEQSGRSTSEGGSAARLPLLQNWLVQQGSLVSPQGERGFALTLQVPSVWAQVVGSAIPAASVAVPLNALPGSRMRLPVADFNTLNSGPLALVLQPQGAAGTGSLATSALLWLELQPMAAMAAQPVVATAATMALTLSASVQGQDAPPLLQNPSDPWLMMAAAQAANALSVSRRHGEHRSHLCTTQGCQYQGLAPCAQPFCSEMNRIWETSRAERGG